MDDRVRQTIERMERQLSRKMSLTELACTAGLSVSQLTRLFRSDTGSTPGAFLNRLRMARARVLVERTTLPLAEVMARVGISDRSHFAREFRRAHGSTARTLRIRQRTPRRGRDASP